MGDQSLPTIIEEQHAEILRLRKVCRDQAGVELSEENDRLIEENKLLRAAIERMAIGCNHIATYRTDRWPDYGTDHEIVLEKLGAGREYDMWCCWNAHMCARDAIAVEQSSPKQCPDCGQEPAGCMHPTCPILR